MKLQIICDKTSEEPLVTVHCRDPQAPELVRLFAFLEGERRALCARSDTGLLLLAPNEILYGEFVGRSVFLYTAAAVCPTDLSLATLEAQDTHFFRCSKSMVVNLSHIRHLQSEASGRILARLSNDEKIMISRHYAAALRRKLTQRSKA